MTEPVPKAADVAQWLWEQLQEQKYLDRWAAIDGVAKRFGEQFTDTTEGGSARIKPNVQAKFRKLYGNQAYYEGRGDDGGWTMHRPR